MKATPAVVLEDVSFSFSGPPVLEHVTLSVPQREFLGIVGPNAGGKSTLLKIILGLLEPTSGKVSVLGKRASQARRHIGYVPQYPLFARDFPITVAQTVLMGRLGKTRALGGFRRRDHELAARMMQDTEIGDLADRHIDTLSGGQLQRVLVARALACEPQLLILDEPTANIDMRVESDIFDLLQRLSHQMTIILVSHDVGFISGYVSRVACLNRTLICHPTATLSGKIITDLYGTEVQMVEHRHRRS